MKSVLIALLTLEAIVLGLGSFVAGFFTVLAAFHWQWVLLTLLLFALVFACGFVGQQLKVSQPGPWLACGWGLVGVGLALGLYCKFSLWTGQNG